MRDVFPLVVVGLALLGCDDDKSPYFGTTERTGKELGTFYVNNGSEPEYLDPGKSHDSGSSTLVHQLFEGLSAYDPREAKPVPAIATSWDQSPDNRMFRFHLRDDAKWSDGVPVTAHDFEYAWKRVLLPATAAQSAANLYTVLNGQLVNLGKLKVTKGAVVVTRRPDGASEKVTELSAGSAVRILATSPMTVTTAIAPFASIPDVTDITFDRADIKQGTPERLTATGKDGKRMEPREPVDGGWKDAAVTLVAEEAAVKCNGATDHWYRLEHQGGTGYLPGCLLADTAGADRYALVGEHRRLPTFTVREGDQAAPAASDSEHALGFVPLSELEVSLDLIGVRAKDDHTLEVELEGPTPYFIDLTCHTTLFPVRKDVIERFEATGEPDMWTRPESIVSNGPYVLDEHKFRYEITMNRNPHYHSRDKLKIHRIVFMEVEEYHSTMNLYKAGEIDFVGENSSLPSEYMDFLSTKKDFQRSWYLSTYWYEFNTRTPPVDDVRVRRALNLAIDKQQLVEKITRAGQMPATHYVPPFTGLGYNAQVKEDEAAGTDPFATPETVHNPERARALLADAGYPVEKDGDGYRAKDFPALEILYNTSEGHKMIAVAIQDMWKRHLGISATIRNEEWKVMLKNVRDGNFQVARFGWVADYNHPHTWMDTFLSYSPQNTTGWADGEFDDLIKRAAATADPKESIRIYRQAEARAVEGMSRIPLYFYTKSTLVKPWVKGYFGNPRDIHLIKWMWIDPEWRQHPDNVPSMEVPEYPAPGAY